MNNTSRRNFLKTGAAAALLPLLTRATFGASGNDKPVIRPDALREGDVIGLITPASPSFEGNRAKIESKLNLESLGFNVKFAKNGDCSIITEFISIQLFCFHCFYYNVT